MCKIQGLTATVFKASNGLDSRGAIASFGSLLVATSTSPNELLGVHFMYASGASLAAGNAVLSKMAQVSIEAPGARLLIVIPVYASYRAFLKGLAAWLTERDWEVHVATSMSGAKVEQDVAVLHDVDMPRGACPLRLLKAASRLTSLIQELQPNVVHAHFSIGILALALSRRVSGSRYLGTFQGMRFPLASGLERGIFKLVECFSILRLDQSWVLTEDDFEAVPSCVRKKLAIQEGYGFGCDIEHFDSRRFTDLDKASLRDQLGIPTDDFVFIFVGRLTAFKGFDLALEAFQSLRRKRKGVHLLVVGELDIVHPLSLPDLNSIKGVHHVGWKKDPAPYLAIANAMVFPSEREGLPVCVMEALSMELPVILADTRGSRELAALAGTHPVLSHRSGDDVYEKMAALVSESATVELGANNVRQQIDRKRFYEHVLEIYGELE